MPLSPFSLTESALRCRVIDKRRSELSECYGIVIMVRIDLNTLVVYNFNNSLISRQEINYLLGSQCTLNVMELDVTFITKASENAILMLE